ncbi:MAG: D-alanyl-D-alanine carboxypeptidase family protein [Lachnospiraceae bacterium]
MKKKYQNKKRMIAAGMIICILLHTAFFCFYESAAGAENTSDEISGLYAIGAVLMDADSGRVLYSKNGQEFMPMASTTKIMTCILALEYADTDDIVKISNEAAAMPDVQLNARAGDEFRMIDLLYSMMLESHNDSAAAIAEHIGGSIRGFAEMMNLKAAELGCYQTHFVTPNGLDGEDENGIHGTTAEELAGILRYCICESPKSEKFLEITRAPSHEFTNVSGTGSYQCRNHNALLTSFQGAVTGKTGFTSKAGYCYVGAVDCGEMTLIVSLLASGWYPHKSYKWSDVRRLLAYGTENYHCRKIGMTEWDLKPVPVTNGMKDSVRVTTDASPIIYPVREGEHLKIIQTYQKAVKAPVTEGGCAGSIRYQLNGKTIREFPVYAAENIEEASFGKKVKAFFEKAVDFVRLLLKKKQNA